MVVALPLPFPDELLYGVVARYIGAGGRPVQEVFWRSLFGRRLVKAEFELPHWLPDLSENLPAVPSLSPGELAWRYTLWPFYGHFAAKPAVSAAYDALASRGEWFPSVRRYHNQVVPVTRLRLCPTCVVNDLARMGEPYWHRAHQLPGVLLCPIHAVPLVLTRIGNHPPERSRFHVVPYDWAQTGRTAVVSEELRPSYRWIARRATRLLQRPLLRDRTGTLFRWYSRRLDRHGLLDHRKVELRLTRAFTARFPKAFLMSLGFAPLTWANGDWIGRLFRRDEPLHPLCHLMVQLFLRTLENEHGAT